MNAEPKVCRRCLKGEPETTFYRKGGLLCVECRARLSSVKLLPIPKPTIGVCPLLKPKRCNQCLSIKPETDFDLIAVRRLPLGRRQLTCSTCCLLNEMARLLPLAPSGGLCPLLAPPTRVCAQCDEEKELNSENFQQRTRYGKPYLPTVCADCERANSLEYYRTRVTPEARRAKSLEYEHSESGKAARARSVAKLKESGWMAQHGWKKHLRREYGLTADEFESLRSQQEGRCAICRLMPSKKLGVDHSHLSGIVRGLLCSGCNAGLGSFHGNTTKMLTAISYLSRPLPLIDRSRSCPAKKGSRDEDLRSLYNITLAGFNDLLHRQGGVCAICHGAAKGKGFGVDHIHGSTDIKIRGILCSPCNFALGNFKDNPTVIASAIWYLHKASKLEVVAA